MKNEVWNQDNTVFYDTTERNMRCTAETTPLDNKTNFPKSSSLVRSTCFWKMKMKMKAKIQTAAAAA